MRRTRGLVAVIAIALTGVISTAPAAAKVVTKTASAALSGGGTVAAKVSYTPRSYYDTGTRLTITRAGKQVLNAAVVSKVCTTYCSVEDLRVADVQQNGEPVVLLDVFTGGAHCCSVTDFYTYNANTRTYRQSEYDWGDPGYSLITLGGKQIFETDDDRFAYAFTDYAASGLPQQFFSFNGTRLVNVTLQYPKAIAANAAFWLKTYQSTAKEKYDDSVGIIAAWAADEDLLGKQARVATYLAAQAKAGHLSSGIPGLAGGLRFVKQLDGSLRKWGYLKQEARRRRPAKPGANMA